MVGAVSSVGVITVGAVTGCLLVFVFAVVL